MCHGRVCICICATGRTCMVKRGCRYRGEGRGGDHQTETGGSCVCVCVCWRQQWRWRQRQQHLNSTGTSTSTSTGNGNGNGGAMANMADMPGFCDMPIYRSTTTTWPHPATPSACGQQAARHAWSSVTLPSLARERGTAGAQQRSRIQTSGQGWANAWSEQACTQSYVGPSRPLASSPAA